MATTYPEWFNPWKDFGTKTTTTRDVGRPVAPGKNTTQTGTTWAGQIIYYQTDENGVTWRIVTDRFGNLIGTPTVYSQKAVTENKPKGGGGGGGGGGGLGARQSYEDLFIAWFGVGGYKIGWLDRALAEQWTSDDVRRFACDNGAQGPEMLLAITETRQAMARAGLVNPSDALVMSIISNGIWGSSSLEDYLPTLTGFDWTKSSNGAQFIDYWIAQTGIPPTATAVEQVGAKIRELGWDGAWDWFQSWVKTTESAYYGNYGATKRAGIADMIGTYLHRLPTQNEINPNSAVWNMEEDALMEYIRKQPEYKVLFGGKPGWMSEDAFLSVRASYDAVWRRIFGIQVPQPTMGVDEFTGELYPQPQVVELPTVVTPTTEPPPWKTLTTATFNTELKKAGITATGSGPTGTYTDATGKVIPWDSLIDYLPEGTFYKDDLGYHYVQAPGAINPKTGVQTPGWVPTPPVTLETPGPGAQPELPTIPGMPPELMRYYLNNFITPEEIWQQASWIEDVSFMRETLNPQLTEALGYGFTDSELYTIASGAQGSGHLRALIMEAENKLAFREVFRNYNGRDPGPGDYDYLMNNFVSPNEYARVTAAYESAVAKLPEINDITERVLGKSYSVDQVQDMVLGRKGSGAMQAEINQALKLDSYTWIFKQRYGRNPTPDEYAGFAGYSGPAELTWEYKTIETIAEYRPEIQKVWQEQFGYQLSDEQLWTLFGEQEGYGDLRAMWKEAQKLGAEEEVEEEAGWNAPRVEIPFAPAAQGGFAIAVKPLANLNSLS